VVLSAGDATGQPPSVVLAHLRDLVLGLGAVLLAVLYVAGVRVLRRRGDRWPPSRVSRLSLGIVTSGSDGQQVTMLRS
jgi:cytochrome c oxidase assembly factor CtaG